jgi:Uma2 family endonuclease
VSPNDLAYEVDEKVEEYMAARVPMVWVINPMTKIVRVHRLNGTGSVLHEHDILSGEEVLPSFECPVSSIFVRPVKP